MTILKLLWKYFEVKKWFSDVSDIFILEQKYFKVPFGTYILIAVTFSFHFPM
jgi:hypothetical protein